MGKTQSSRGAGKSVQIQENSEIEEKQQIDRVETGLINQLSSKGRRQKADSKTRMKIACSWEKNKKCTFQKNEESLPTESINQGNFIR